MSAISQVIRRTDFTRLPAPRGLRLATVSLFALSAALSAGPARADCTAQGLDHTCSGTLEAIDIEEDNATSNQTVTLTIENATNQSATGPGEFGTAAWALNVTAPGNSETSAQAQLNVDLDGFDVNGGAGAGIFVQTTGSGGIHPSENEGKGDRSGDPGGVGGDGGAITATISGVDITAGEYNALLQSVGGQGGQGAKGYSKSGGDGYGGNGGDGGDGGAVSATVTNSTLNQGDGLYVRSTGQLGGEGGEGTAADHTARGGKGGNGGAGGNVGLVVQDVTINSTTAADTAITGIAVQSHGGQAGMGGKGKNTLTSDGYGGGGGIGGGGGGIHITNTAADGSTGGLEIEITLGSGNTSGSGILGESIAGNGGKGGEGEGLPGVGGDGRQGGTGGSVSVDIAAVDDGDNASISISGDGGAGIVARSYGGAGGDGGTGGHGGAGAGSGPGGGVGVNYVGDIATNGSLSDGIMAQSIGGFAGNAANSSGIIAYGASSQSAGGGGGVTVNYDGSGGTGLVTSGDDSDGIFAQSQGGGGGKASTTTGLVALSGDETGSSGGNGGALGITAAGTITTTGARSRGIVAQSIGGTGGDGGSGRGVVGIGGTGSNGGQGSHVSATSSADITTSGDDSIGILLQSIGGGGGSAGSSAGITAIGGRGGSGATSGEVTAQIGGSIATTGSGSDGVLAQSIGGSGGQGGNAFSASTAFSMSIAGNGGVGNNGGAVELNTLAGSSISTAGDNARGLAAMSVGGGGGHGGNAIAVSANLSPNISVAIGGSGGAAGDGESVTLNTLGSVTTGGDNATGMSALSVGGSGGSAGTTVSSSAGMGDLSLAVGGNGGGGGDGSDISVCRGGNASNSDCTTPATAGRIQTTGDGAVGLMAASVGGGGGQSGTTLSATTGGGTAIAIGGNNLHDGSSDHGEGGRGGDITVYSSGGIHTSGAASSALVATSIGGSGGDAHVVGAFDTFGNTGTNVAVGSVGGSSKGSGDVSVTSNDTIATQGVLSSGIKATSHGGSGGTGSAVFTGAGVSSGSANISVGGQGGGGGSSGDVDVDWTGSTLTTGSEQSVGILAQSQAGSGGNGGATVSGQGAGLATSSVTIGTKGGLGGNAGAVSVNVSGHIETTGFMSEGVVAMSQGGNGGRGGMSITGDGVSQGNAAVTLGGNGGIGGTAGTATIRTHTGSTITTDGSGSVGVSALSLGGNGGQGGMAVETGVNVSFTDEVPAGDATFSLGGDGHTGGTSAEAYVNNRAVILTKDFNSHGVQAQSIAGSGGSGAMAVSGTLDAGNQTQLNANVAMGGNGGKGAQAGQARVENTADITTMLDNSNGILAQSIGGSGGAGGMTYNVLTNIASGGTTNLNFGVSVGGHGNTGGTAGVAYVNNGSEITTYGTSSSGIYAQSIGGNGGAGGFGGTGIYDFGKQQANPDTSTVKVNLNATVGGTGGQGATGNNVTVVNQGGGHINTQGGGAYGIFAQSVGGNGGDGGLATNFSQGIAGIPGSPPEDEDDSDKSKKSTSLGVSLKIGGGGSAGADAGDVSVTNSAHITTRGDVAHGIISQSVGGGGGTGGGAATNFDSFVTRTIGGITGETAHILRNAYNFYNIKDDFGNANFAIGGTGGAAGQGGDASVVNDGQQVVTFGDNAYGIFSQSIGGGGGSGGEGASITDSFTLQLGGNGGGGGDAGTASINTTGLVATHGFGSTAVFAQSVGGGGGNTGSKTGFGALDLATLAIGGQDGVSGDGGDVTVTYNSGTLTTTGEQASGIFAQSVGGGGGTHFGGAATLDDDADWSMTVGGTGKSNGDGGDVTVVSAADIVTGPAIQNDATAASMGIFAQSVGGGGGYGGSMILGDYTRIRADARSSNTSVWGDGGAVTVNQSGTITTTGDNSVGIFAQSVGGAGGVRGNIDRSSTEGAYVGSFGGKGAAGVVTVAVGGTITTSGAGAHGIFAQFASGEDASQTADTTVSVAQSASIYTSGAGAHAIHVENGGSSAGEAEITIGGSSVIQGGTAAIYDNAQSGAGVYVNSDRNSTLNNAGKISALSGVAINSLGGGTLTVNNNGTVTGNVLGSVSGNIRVDNPTQTTAAAVGAAPQDQAQSAIQFDNLSDGILSAGDTVDVAQLRNWGQVHVGQFDKVASTHVSGDLLHNAGHLNFDLDLSSNETDVLTIGGAARLSGALRVNVLQSDMDPNGAQDLKIIEAAGGLDASELEIIPSVVARYKLNAVSDTELHLGYHIDYANGTLVGALNDNQSRLTTYFDSLYDIGDLDDDLAKALIDITTTQDYARVMNTLGPELATSNGVASLYRTLGFANTLFSCPNQGQGNVWMENGQCAYVTFGGSRLDRDATGGASGFAQDGWRIGAGGQMLLDNGITIGAALAYDSSSLTTDAGASSDGSSVSGGLSVKRFVDAWEFGAAVYAGNGSFDNTRTVGTGTLTGTQDQWTTGAELRAGYVFDQGDWFIKPRLDLGVAHFGGGSYAESGAATALSVDTSSETFSYLRPAVELGGSVATTGGSDIRLNAVLSMTQFFGNPSFDATARLANAPGSVAPVTWQSDIDNTQFDLTAGITILSANGISYDVSAFGHLTDNQRGYGGQLRINIPF